MENNYHKVGVIIGRFQVSKLTYGHTEILNYVLNKKHTQNILILGNAPLKLTTKNPLDFESRRRMFEENSNFSGKFTIAHINDVPCDKKWSKNLDKLISDLTSHRPVEDVILYGSRDSFKNKYHGIYTTKEYNQKTYVNGTDIRRTCGKLIGNSEEWRSGVIWSTQNKTINTHMAVNCAVFCDDKFNELYVVKTDNDDKYKFIGGFVNPKSTSLENSIMKIVYNKTNLNITNIKYITSMRINNWKYINEEEKVISAFFTAKEQPEFKKLIAQENVNEICRVKFKDLKKSDFNVEHHGLFDNLCFSVDNLNLLADEYITI